MRSHTSSAASSTPLGPAAALHGVHDDEPAARLGQLRIAATGREIPGCRSGKRPRGRSRSAAPRARKLSTESGVPSAASAAISGSRRRISSAAATGLASTLLAAAPRSMICAPAATSARACASAAAGSRKRPPSENKSSVMLTMPRIAGPRIAAVGTAQPECPRRRVRSMTAPTPSASGKTSSFSTHARTRSTRGSAKQAAQIRSAKPSHRSICPDPAISRIAATIFS